jgi:hypothetical protein
MYRLYIGSNNKSKRLEVAKINAIISSVYDGFTMYRARGVWRGAGENTAVVEIGGAKKRDILRLCKRLKVELKQEAIGLQEVPEMKFIA